LKKCKQFSFTSW